MIERNIWQTYETPLSELPPYAQRSIKLWKIHNAGWTHGYMSGPEREEFFKNNFEKTVYDVYMSLPLGVMKAGLWRFAVLYIYGGVYADMDTHCRRPINSWLDGKYDMVLDIERDTPWLATQTFAAKSGHPLLKASIDLCVERVGEGIIDHNHMVHYYTDVQMFTDALYREAGVTPYEKHLSEWAAVLNTLPYLVDNKIHIFHGPDARRLLDRDVKHLYWGDDREKGWIAWKKDPRVNQSYPNGFNPHDWKEE